MNEILQSLPELKGDRSLEEIFLRATGPSFEGSQK
jgi:hypothetical protein